MSPEEVDSGPGATPDPADGQGPQGNVPESGAEPRGAEGAPFAGTASEDSAGAAPEPEPGEWLDAEPGEEEDDPGATGGKRPKIQPLQFSQIQGGGGSRPGSLELLLDVKLPISVELGRTEALVQDILEYGPGTVIELAKLAGDPIDVLVNGRLVAQGEIVVVDEHFGVRVTNLLSPKDRVRSLA